MKSQTLIASGYFCGLATKPTRYKGQESKSSKSIVNSDGDIAMSLFRAFKLNKDSDLQSFRKAYDMAKDGDGGEDSKILTVHSSALLALLCFFSISPENPLTIGKDRYTEVMFEVKNVVIKADRRKPSNIDVLLVSKSEDGNVRKLLFLESKFTEYVVHGKVQLPTKYHAFYNALKDKIRDLQFQISTFTVHHKDGTTGEVFGLSSPKRQYLGGIKQAFSHLLGIATHPANDSNPYRKIYKEYYRQAEEIEFATIVHDWNTEESDRYQQLYADTFKSKNVVAIKEVLKEIAPNHEAVDRLTIRLEILTYKDVFKDFNLPGIIRKAYNL